MLQEFILAEAGTGLSLQQDNDKNDPLWHGAGALEANMGLGMQLCKLFCTTDDQSLVVNNLLDHPTYKDQCLVTEGPMLRFLAAVPLRSPLYKYIIGIYIVVDDKPRDGLNEDELEFLKDLGVTCMDHLGKSTPKHHDIFLMPGQKHKGTTRSSIDRNA